MSITADYRKDVPPLIRAAMDRLADPHGAYGVFRAPGVSEEMERLARARIPSVLAAENGLLALGDWVRGDDAKRVFGRLAKFIMTEELGYVQGSSGVRAPHSALFTKGTTFHPPQDDIPVPEAGVIGTDASLHALANELLCLAAKKFAAVNSGQINADEVAALHRAVEALR